MRGIGLSGSPLLKTGGRDNIEIKEEFDIGKAKESRLAISSCGIGDDIHFQLLSDVLGSGHLLKDRIGGQTEMGIADHIQLCPHVPG